MKIFSGVGIGLLLITGAFGQHRGGFANTHPIFGRQPGGRSVRGGQPEGGVGPGSVVVVPFVYPVYVGGGYYDPPADPGALGAMPVPVQPNGVVVYPPSAAPPVINSNEDQQETYQSAPQQLPERVNIPDLAPYLIAFKDGTVDSAAAYEVNDDTLRYITSHGALRQAQLSLVDRRLTERLNRESGLNMRLPGETTP